MTPVVEIALVAPPALEERLVDWLLEQGVEGFTTHPAQRYGAPVESLSVAEQVSGRQRRIELRLELPADGLDAFVAALEADLRGTDVYYVVRPVLRAGHLTG